MKLSGSWSLVKGKSRLSTGCVATNCPAAFCTRTERSKGSALFEFHIPLSTLFHTAVQQHWLLRCKERFQQSPQGMVHRIKVIAETMQGRMLLRF